MWTRRIGVSLLGLMGVLLWPGTANAGGLGPVRVEPPRGPAVILDISRHDVGDLAFRLAYATGLYSSGETASLPARPPGELGRSHRITWDYCGTPLMQELYLGAPGGPVVYTLPRDAAAGPPAPVGWARTQAVVTKLIDRALKAGNPAPAATKPAAQAPDPTTSPTTEAAAAPPMRPASHATGWRAPATAAVALALFGAFAAAGFVRRRRSRSA